MVSVRPENVLDDVLDALVAASVNYSEASDKKPISLLDHLWGLFEESKITANQLIKVIEVADRLTMQNTLLIDAVELALSHDAVAIARELVQRGNRLYPDNEILQKLSSILDIPKVLASNQPPRVDLAPSMEWLRNHSSNYVGSWVALENGKLLGTAATRKALVEQLGNGVNIANILITKIPA